MAKMKDLLVVDTPLVNDCVICDAAAVAAREGRKSFSVSVGFDAPMCNDCWDFRMQEMMS